MEKNNDENLNVENDNFDDNVSSSITSTPVATNNLALFSKVFYIFN